MQVYKGKENYIFISYSHKNEKEVLSIAEELAKDGYRVWYDEGIDPGTEWPEIVAEHLNSCALFLAFLSDDYMDSFNCKREVDFAIRKRKNIIAVYLKETKMTLGMEMQLSSVQSIDLYQLKRDVFFQKLKASGLLESCKEGTAVETDEPMEISRPKDGQEKAAPKEERAGDEKEKKKDRKKNKPEKRTGEGKSRRMGLIIAGVIAGVILAVILIRVITVRVTGTEIAGERVQFSEGYVHIKDVTVTMQDMEKLRRFGDNLHSLGFENCTLPEGSEEVLSAILPSVHFFTLTGCTGIRKFDFLSAGEEISQLNLAHMGLTDEILATLPFSSMKNLSLLDISENKKITDLTPVSAASELDVLYINHTKVSDLSPLSSLSGLFRLEADDCAITSLSPLKELVNFKSLHANGNDLTDLSGIENAANLEDLQVEHNDLKNLDELEHVISLKKFLARGNELESIEGLKNSTILKQVDLRNNKISDISVLSKSAGTMERLFLDWNDITDITALSGMVNLKSLGLNHNQITDLEPLRGDIALTCLSAEHNQITTMEPVCSLTKLKHLYLSDNVIADISTEIYAEEPVTLLLQHNKIGSIKFFGKAPDTLSVFDNPLERIEDGNNPLELNPEDYPEVAPFEIYTGYITWYEEDEELGIVAFPKLDVIHWFHNAYISGCPDDERLEVSNLASRVEYTTEEYMEKMAEESKASYFYDIY